MLTDEEKRALINNKIRRARETWVEAKGIMAALLVPTAEVFLDTLEALIKE